MLDRKCYGLVLGAVLLMVIPAPLFGQGPPPKGGKAKIIIAVGQAPANVAGAEEEAVQKALRTAVEQAAGVFIASQTETEKFQLIKDRVMAKAAGFVFEHEVLSKSVNAGVLSVRVRAVVSLDRFEQEWAAIREALLTEKMPLFMVVVPEEIDGRYDIGHAAEGEILSVFIEKGFPPVDKGQIEENRERDLTKADHAGDMSKVAAFGARYGAQIIIIGKATTGSPESQMIYNVGHTFFHASIEVRAVRTDDAGIIASESADVRKGSTNPHAAAKLALREAGRLVASKLVDAVMRNWQQRATAGRRIQVLISSASFKDYRNLRRWLGEISAVKHVFPKEYTNKVAMFDVEATIDAETLAERLLDLEGIQLEVTQALPNRIDLKVVE